MRMKMAIEHLTFSPDTRLYPIIGCPMGQSSAAYCYNVLLAACGIDEVMWPIEIPAGGLEKFLAAARTIGMRHVAVTMPHKAAIIPLLDEVEDDSRLFNSVNAVRIGPDGRTSGVGLDGKGNREALRAAGVDVGGMNVFIAGAGSIVGVIMLELSRAGARRATVVNRSLEKAEKLAAKVRPHMAMEVECLGMTNANLDRAAERCDLMIQCTPLGMFGYSGDWEYLGFMDRLRPGVPVMETIVNPPLTAVVRRARERGLKTIYGIDMMVGNKIDAFRFQFGIELTPAHLEAARKNTYRYFNLEA